MRALRGDTGEAGAGALTRDWVRVFALEAGCLPCRSGTDVLLTVDVDELRSAILTRCNYTSID